MSTASGFILIDKPENWTSHDVVAYLRKVTGVKKIGHSGTLDPFATGLLIVGVGREATKRLDEFKAMDKTYEATLRLGAVSDTYDRTGTIVLSPHPAAPSSLIIGEEKIRQTLKKFIGAQTQTPPMYSAKKVGGKKLYELARKGIEIERRPEEITIYDIRLNGWEPEKNFLHITCHVSSGTYIRTLAHDIGQALGTGAYCEELRRTAIGEYKVVDAIYTYPQQAIRTFPLKQAHF